MVALLESCVPVTSDCMESVRGALNAQCLGESCPLSLVYSIKLVMLPRIDKKAMSRRTTSLIRDGNRLYTVLDPDDSIPASLSTNSRGGSKLQFSARSRVRKYHWPKLRSRAPRPMSSISWLR